MTHETNLLAFFRYSINKDIGASWVTGKKAKLWHVVEFLDEKLRCEIKLYEQNSTGYHYFVDMLIELHVMTEDSVLANSLLQDANDCYLFVR